MSEPDDLKPEPAAMRDGADKRTIAQVEKWMAMIREMSGEEKEEKNFRPDAVPAPVTE